MFRHTLISPYFFGGGGGGGHFISHALITFQLLWQGEHAEALDLFDQHIHPIAHQVESSFSRQDMSALLYRLEMEGK